VLDLSRLLPGPFATLVLADLGAQVDKVEDPELGDYTRHMVPLAGGTSVAFHALNRGKRSLVFDLKAEGGAAAFRRLARSYDVVFDQFRPGVMDRLGVGHSVLLADNPRLVLCALTGYGQSGPLRDKAGHDLNYLARSGLLGMMGPADGPPQPPSFQLADVAGGLWSVVSILAALRERDRTGKGAVLDIGMTDSVLPFATVGLSRALALGSETVARGGEVITGGAAAYNTYLTKDGGAVSLGALEPKFLQRFCRGAGIEFDPMAIVPGPHQAKFKAEFTALFLTRTRAEWQAFGEEHDCCLEQVLTPEEALKDAHLNARGAFVKAEAGGDSFLEYRTPVSPRDAEIRPAPRTGEHTDAVLAEAGFSADDVAALKRDRVVR
jgi:crotonobetainyl-CoA:carnitine CoA-transferase CaiB-like acyl-CoA transferase